MDQAEAVVLGDRIARGLIRDGKMLQIAPPTDIYNKRPTCSSRTSPARPISSLVASSSVAVRRNRRGLHLATG